MILHMKSKYEVIRGPMFKEANMSWRNMMTRHEMDSNKYLNLLLGITLV